MAITTTCSGCGKTLAVADQFAGRQARCPACNTIYTVPQPAPPSPPTDIVAAADWGDPFDKRPIELNAVDNHAVNTNAADPNAVTPIEPASAAIKPPNLATTVGGYQRPVDPQETADLPELIDQPEQPIELEPLKPGTAPPSITPLTSSDMDTPSDLALYWMRAADGNEYGPADTDTLARWFREGRVGPNYTIRQGEHGQWQPAVRFAPRLDTFASSANPFSSPVNVNSTPYVGYAKSDQSGLVLAMGILTWLAFCPVFGLIAWAVGAQALHDMQVGNTDPTNRSLVQFGYYSGMINVIIWACCLGFTFLSMIA